MLINHYLQYSHLSSNPSLGVTPRNSENQPKKQKATSTTNFLHYYQNLGKNQDTLISRATIIQSEWLLHESSASFPPQISLINSRILTNNITFTKPYDNNLADYEKIVNAIVLSNLLPSLTWTVESDGSELLIRLGQSTAMELGLNIKKTNKPRQSTTICLSHTQTFLQPPVFYVLTHSPRFWLTVEPINRHHLQHLQSRDFTW